MYVGNGGIFALGSLSTRAKMPSLQILRPEALCLKQNLEGVVSAGELASPSDSGAPPQVGGPGNVLAKTILAVFPQRLPTITFSFVL